MSEKGCGPTSSECGTILVHTSIGFSKSTPVDFSKTTAKLTSPIDSMLEKLRYWMILVCRIKIGSSILTLVGCSSGSKKVIHELQHLRNKD